MADREIVDVVDIVRSGQKIILPEDVPLTRVIARLVRQSEYEEELVYVSAVFSCLPDEGAVAMHRVLDREFGFVQTKDGSSQETREVQIGVNETVSVNWGVFEVPGLDAQEYIETSQARNDDGRIVFSLTGRVRRKNETIFQKVVALVRDEVRTNSIYKGKAWRISLHDEDGDPYYRPTPEFIELNPNVGDMLTFSDDVMASIRLNLWGFIEHTEEFRKRGVSLKHGTILTGSYGVGKSMTATATANLAVANGWTYIVAENADELADVARLAREYGPCVLTIEDIDRVVSGERNISMDEMLNVVDGIESKNVELLLFFTTNDLDSIHEAMLRPGRIDGVITLQYPDEKATERMIRVYAGDSLSADTDISRAVELIAHNRTSGVAEVAKRAVRSMIITGGESLTSDNVYEAALSVKNQLDGLAREKRERELSDNERAAEVLVKGLTGIVIGRKETSEKAKTNGHATDISIPMTPPQG